MMTAPKGFKVDDYVWKEGGQAGYAGPGRVVAVFKNWTGARRYVVAHRIADGVGEFYHIYSDRELNSQPAAVGDSGASLPPHSREGSPPSPSP